MCIALSVKNATMSLSINPIKTDPESSDPLEEEKEEQREKVKTI
jgi:hypothetical protein